MALICHLGYVKMVIFLGENSLNYKTFFYLPKSVYFFNNGIKYEERIVKLFEFENGSKNLYV